MEFLDTFFNQISIDTTKPFFSISIFFTAGVLSSLFPCYYPLIPITIGFLQKKSSNFKATWIAPLLYWIGTMILYLILGVLAATSGIILSQMMQNGWFILFLGIFFVYLSFAMLDFVSLEPVFFRKLEDKTKQKQGILFIIVMGFVAGLAASACVSPALVSILLFIAQISSNLEVNTSTILFGVILTTSYGAGLGLPFFLSGILGAKLPRSGKWMNIIKYSFAIVILLVAIYQIHKALLTFRIPEDIITISIVGIIAILVLLYYFIKKILKSDYIYKINQYFVYITIIILSITFSFTIFIYGESKSLISDNLEIMNHNYGKYEFANELKIYRSVKEAMDIAKSQQKPIFIDFYADWCTNCVEFSKLMKNDPKLISILKDMIILKIYDFDPAFDFFSNHENYMELQIGLPFFVITTPDLKILYKTNYYKDFENFKKKQENFYKNQLQK